MSKTRSKKRLTVATVQFKREGGAIVYDPHGSRYVRGVSRFLVRKYGGAREFRVQHRARIRDALAAVLDATKGCVHSPAWRSLVVARLALRDAIELTRAKNWER